ncbi:MAG TPA: phosphoadenosine phosphosulfate reductase family protein, partial [Acidimicrobiia bacterium]
MMVASQTDLATARADIDLRADVDLEELHRVAAELEGKPAGAAVRWAWERYGTGIFVAASFQDTVLIDVAVREVPEIEVVFLDTQYHFAETLWYVD